MKVYVFSVRYFSEDAHGMVTSAGVVAGESPAKAVEKLTEELFDNVDTVSIYETDGSDFGMIGLKALNEIVDEHELISAEE